MSAVPFPSGFDFSAVADRFWSKVAIGEQHECWPWLSVQQQSGHGRFSIQGNFRPAHRVAYALSGFDVPSDKMVCHSCDNPPCCNPAHLWLGDHASNMLDKLEKGRCSRLRGAQNGQAKLTEQDVRLIRSSPLSTRKLAALLGVGQRTVSDARNGTKWGWLS